MGGDRQRNRQTPIHGQYLNGRWPTRRKLMGRACCCRPPLLGPRPQWHRTHGAAHCVCSSPRPALYGPCVPVYPPGPLTPVLSVTGDNFAFLVFLPCMHRACGSSPIPNPAALHLRGTQSSKISAARGGSKPAQLHRRFTTNSIRTSPLLPTHPCLPPFDTVACRSLALFSPFCTPLFLLPNTPLAITKLVDRLATGPTSQPKHRMSGSHNVHRQHHHHPPLC